MDICSIVEFREALLNPDHHFSTLKNIVADISTICRSRHFAECSATINGHNAMIYAPISPQAITLAHNTIATLHNIDSRMFSKITLHSCEMRRMNHNTPCSIIVEWPPYAMPLSEVIYTMSQRQLLNELDELHASLKHNNVSHNNLTGNNILVDNIGRWHLVRQYYSSTGATGDDTAIAHLRTLIKRDALADIESTRLCVAMADYHTSQPRLVEHRRKIVIDSLTGFTDENDRIVIECRYGDATFFAEHRSVVTMPDGRMGVIDIDGNEIIPALFDTVSYDVNSGRVWVTLNGQAAEFDYHGKQLGEWQPIDELDTELLR